MVTISLVANVIIIEHMNYLLNIILNLLITVHRADVR